MELLEQGAWIAGDVAGRVLAETLLQTQAAERQRSGLLAAKQRQRRLGDALLAAGHWHLDQQAAAGLAVDHEGAPALRETARTQHQITLLGQHQLVIQLRQRSLCLLQTLAAGAVAVVLESLQRLLELAELQGAGQRQAVARHHAVIDDALLQQQLLQPVSRLGRGRQRLAGSAGHRQRAGQQAEREADQTGQQYRHQRGLQGGAGDADADVLVVDLHRQQGGDQVAEGEVIGDLGTRCEPFEAKAQQQLVDETDAEEHHQLARTGQVDVGKLRQLQQQVRRREDHQHFGEGGRQFHRLVPLQRQQRGDQDAVEFPGVVQVEARGDPGGGQQDDVGLGAGKDRAGDVLVQVVEAAEREVGQLHQAEAHDHEGDRQNAQQLETTAQQARLPEVVGDQRHDDQAEAVQVVGVVELHALGVEPGTEARQPEGIEQHPHHHADQHQRKEAVAAEEIRQPQPARPQHRKAVHQQVGDHALAEDHRHAPGLDQQQRHQIAGHHQARQAPAEAQVEEGHYQHADPHGGDDRAGQAPFGEQVKRQQVPVHSCFSP